MSKYSSLLVPRLVGELHARFAESTRLEQAVTANLKGMRFR